MKTNSLTLSQLLSHYDGSFEQTLILLNLLKKEPEETQLLILRLILSLCELKHISQDSVTNCFPPATTYVESVRLLRNTGLAKGVMGHYKVVACKRCSDGTEVTPRELPFSTRSGKMLYLLTLSLSSSELGMGQGLNRADIRVNNIQQYDAITRLFRLVYGDKVKDAVIRKFIVNVSRYADDHNFFSRTKHDTNMAIAKRMTYESTPFLINGDKNETRRIKASIDIERSEPEIIDCLRDFAQTTRPTWPKAV